MRTEGIPPRIRVVPPSFGSSCRGQRWSSSRHTVLRSKSRGMAAGTYGDVLDRGAGDDLASQLGTTPSSYCAQGRCSPRRWRGTCMISN